MSFEMGVPQLGFHLPPEGAWRGADMNAGSGEHPRETRPTCALGAEVGAMQGGGGGDYFMKGLTGDVFQHSIPHWAFRTGCDYPKTDFLATFQESADCAK